MFGFINSFTTSALVLHEDDGVKKSPESDYSGPTEPGFSPDSWLRHRDFFQAFQAEPIVLTWPRGLGILESHKRVRLVLLTHLVHLSIVRVEGIPRSFQILSKGMSLSAGWMMISSRFMAFQGVKILDERN